VRASLAKAPSKKKKETAPGIGLKFVRDGVDSANLVSMYKTQGQPTWNFFANDFSNNIPPLTGGLLFLGEKFSSYTDYV